MFFLFEEGRGWAGEIDAATHHPPEKQNERNDPAVEIYKLKTEIHVYDKAFFNG